MAVPYKLNYFEIETGIDSTSTFIHTGDLTATKVKKYLATSNDILLGDGTTTSLSGLQPTGNYITALTGEATATGPGSVAITLTNSAVIGKVLSGLSITGSTIASTDTILQAFGKVQNQINGKQATITLTTTGTSGAATFISNVLNIPQYTDAFVGTVTSVAALTLGTTGTDLSSTVANSTTTPVITLNVPTASAANRGALSSADWTTFNSKQDAITLTTTGSSGASTFISNTLNVPTYTLSGLGGVPTTRQLTINGTAYDLSADRSWSVGTVTSVGLTMPAAFSIANSPVTTSGTIAVTGAGLASQYVRGDLALGDFPNTGGGGSSVSYYLNGSINQGTFVGNTYYEMNKTPVIGAGTDFTINANGYIAQFITDANDPASLLIPGGNWNVEMYFSASSNGGSPSFYVEVYKYDGTAFTLLGSSSATPEGITNGTAIDIYYTSVGIPETVLTLTDRIAIRVYVTHSGRTITLHTEDNHLSEIVTTFSNGLTALNGLTKQVQFLAVGTSGTDFNISSSVDTHTFNIPTASATNRGALSFTDWTTFNGKQAALSGTGIVKSTAGVISYLTDPLPIANGGTGSATQNFVDLTTNQSIAGGKTFTSQGNFQAGLGVVNNSFGATSLSVSSSGLQSTGVSGNADYYGIKGIGNVAGVYGVITSATGSAINGEATTGYAGYFFNSSASNPTIYARNTNASGILLQLQGITGNTVFSVANSGALTLASTITNGTYTYTLPSATGTLALTSALTGYVPYTGATTDLVLGANNFSSKRVSVLKSSDGFGGFTSNYLFLETGTSSGSVGTDGVSINSKPSTRGLVINYDIATVNYSVELNASLLTNSRTLNFPDASGTLALTSALSSYLPLTGGTLTGALNGTSATFSSTLSATGLTATSAYSYLYGLRISGNDTGNTIYQATGALGISTGGSAITFAPNLSTALTLASTGQVAIGAALTGRLSVRGTTNDSTAYAFEAGNSSGNTLFAVRNDGAATFSSSVTGVQGVFSASAGTYAGGSLILKSSTGTNPIYLTSNSGFFALSNGGAGDHLLIASTGAATFSSSVTAAGATFSGTTAVASAAGTSQMRIDRSGTVARIQNYDTGQAANISLAYDGGNVGIGTASPSTLLNIEGNDAGAAVQLRIKNNNITTGNKYLALIVGGTTGASVADWSNSGILESVGGTGSNLVLGNFENGPIIFQTNGRVEKMRITSGGNVGIGTTSPTAKLYVLGSSTTESVYYAEKSTASFTGNIITSLCYTASGTGWNHFIGYSDIGSTTNIKIIGNGNIQNANNSYGALSDIKLKENITDATPKLNDLLKVKVRNFNLKSSDVKQIGVIAQELEQIFPSMIEETENFGQVEIIDEQGNITQENQSLGTFTKAVKYSVFVPMLIKAIQELKAEIDLLKGQPIIPTDNNLE